MKKILVVTLCCLAASAMLKAQDTVLVPLDKSPLDITYCPRDYPLQRIQEKPVGPLIARVIHGRPQKNGRAIFGDLIEYGKVWRFGANEATEIEFFRNVKLDDVAIRKGRYTLYAIPGVEKWTIIVNKETDIWGSFKYDSKKDVARINVPVVKQENVSEIFTMLFEPVDKNYALNMYWDDIRLTIPITL